MYDIEYLKSPELTDKAKIISFTFVIISCLPRIASIALLTYWVQRKWKGLNKLEEDVLDYMAAAFLMGEQKLQYEMI